MSPPSSLLSVVATWVVGGEGGGGEVRGSGSSVMPYPHRHPFPCLSQLCALIQGISQIWKLLFLHVSLYANKSIKKYISYMDMLDIAVLITWLFAFRSSEHILGVLSIFGGCCFIQDPD